MRLEQRARRLAQEIPNSFYPNQYDHPANTAAHLGGFVAGVVVALATLTWQPAFVTAAEGVSEYRLANGLKVLLFPDASRPTVTVNVRPISPLPNLPPIAAPDSYNADADTP